MATSVLSSIGRFGRTEPFDLQVSRGQITGHQVVNKFGYSAVIDGTLYPVWNVAANRTYLTTAAVMKISSSSASDAAAGTGARTVLIEGLDQNYAPISEIITLNGQTAVDTTKSYLRVTGITALTTGTGGSNAGILYAGTGSVTSGVPAVVHELAPIGFNKEASGVFTVPAGYTAYLRMGGLTAHDNGAGFLTGRLVISNQGSPFITTAVTVFSDGVAGYSFSYPVAIPEKSDVEARVISSSGTNTGTAYFQYVLIKDNGQA